MNCPACGSKLNEEVHKVKIVHRFGKKPNTLRNKSAQRYVFQCGNCEKHFIIGKMLVECEVLD